jgi:serine/threonine-protein kinase
LVHPNIVTIHAIGEADGHHFLEMEFIRGKTLQQLVDAEGRLTPLRASSLATQVAQGLAAAHREGIVHRDLKLDNVLLTEQGVPKLADFGLAKRVRKAGQVDGEVLAGTPNYMAPELFHGQPATTASDVYALGVCYYVLLTGRLPFVGSSLNDLIQKVTEDPLPNVRHEFDDVPLEMAECLGLMLAKSPANRPHSGIEAAQLLHAIWGQVRDIESLLKEAFLDYGGVSWTRDAGRYQIQLEFPDGRGQKVFMENSEHGAAERLLLIYSLCCEARSEYYEDALRLNAVMAHGGLAIRTVDGQDMFCVIDTFPRASVDGLDVRRSVLEVGYRADSVEKLLTGEDVH